MNNKNQRVFKFVRKEYQASQEINPKKPEEKKNRSLPKQEQKLRQHIHYFAHDQPQEKQQKKNRKQQEIEVAHQIGEQKVMFDRKLTKIAMPQSFERIHLMKKIQNRLMACLERRKPHVPVKQLISQETLTEIMDKKERNLITKRPFGEKLNYQAQSLRKSHNIQEKPKDVIEEIQLKAERQAFRQNHEDFGLFELEHGAADHQQSVYESSFQQFNFFGENSFQSQSCFAKLQQRPPERRQPDRNTKKSQFSNPQKLFFKEIGNYISKDILSLDQFEYDTAINLKNLRIPKLIHNQRTLQCSRITQQQFSFIKQKPKGIFEPLSIFKPAGDEKQLRRNQHKNKNDVRY